MNNMEIINIVIALVIGALCSIPGIIMLKNANINLKQSISKDKN